MRFRLRIPSVGDAGPICDRVTVRHAARSGFTMVEIALCLAIIAFALVAIIGVLPTGLNVQKTNREETIVDQDAVVWMNAIRNGAQGYDDLTNYVVKILNYWTHYTSNGVVIAGPKSPGYQPDVYRYADSAVTSISPPPFCPLTNGLRIIGLLSTPKITPWGAGVQSSGFQSNYVVAEVRAISGAAVEKFPQKNQDVLDLAFSYRMIAELDPYVPFDPYATEIAYAGTNNALARLRVVEALQNNSYDIRLTFRWPLLPDGDAGDGRQTFRLFSGGNMLRTNDVFAPGQPLYLLQPFTYEQASR